MLEVLSEAYGEAPIPVRVVAGDEALGVDVAPRGVVLELPHFGHLPPRLGEEGVVDGHHAVLAPPGGLLDLEEPRPPSV